MASTSHSAAAASALSSAATSSSIGGAAYSFASRAARRTGKSPATSLLHRDVIHCIYDFLTPREILYESIYRVSRFWNHSMREYSIKRLSIIPIRLNNVRKLSNTLTRLQDASIMMISATAAAAALLYSSSSSNFLSAITIIDCAVGSIDSEVNLSQFYELLQLLPGLHSFSCCINDDKLLLTQKSQQQQTLSRKKKKKEKKKKWRELRACVKYDQVMKEIQEDEKYMRHQLEQDEFIIEEQQQQQQQQQQQKKMPELAAASQMRVLDLRVCSWSLDTLMNDLRYFPHLEQVSLHGIQLNFDLTPLVACHALTSVTLSGIDHGQDAWDGDAFLRQFHALATIRHLYELSINGGDFSGENLLVREGIVFLELRYWELKDCLNEWKMQSLLQIAPNLTQLKPGYGFEDTAFQLLPQMQRLESVIVQLPKLTQCDIVNVLSRCHPTTLTHIEFDTHAPYTEDDWYRLLSSLPLLTSLTFTGLNIMRPPLDKKRDPLCVEKTKSIEQGLFGSERNRTIIARQIRSCKGLESDI